MDEIALFEEICALLHSAGVEIRTERFNLPPNSAGGLCRVAGKHLVLLHSGASRGERACALLEVVEQIGLDRLGIKGPQLSPGLLKRLNQRGQMPWPHRSQAPAMAKAQGLQHNREHLKLIMTPPPLSQLTTIGLGGAPSQFETARTESELIELVREHRTKETSLYILGGGSNIVAADNTLQASVIKMGILGITTTKKRGYVLVTAGAGECWHDFAAQMTEDNLAGVECLGGIPGSVGATPIQNVGAYAQEVSQVISKVRVLNKRTLKLRDLSPKDCQFGYRTSLFKGSAQNNYVVVSVTFRLTPAGAPQISYGELEKAVGPSPTLKSTFETVLELRKNKSMVYDPSDVNHRSCGSFFLNAQLPQSQVDVIESRSESPVPQFKGEADLVKIPAAWLIEQAGFPRGLRVGNVGLSTKHTLCLVAHTGATSHELVAFAGTIRRSVLQKFGVQLIPEPNFWGFSEDEAGLPKLSTDNHESLN